MDKENQHKNVDEEILNYIKTRDFAKVSEIKRFFNFSDERNVRKAVKRLREKGHAICMGANGYYYSNDPAEIDKTINKLLSQAKGQIETAKDLKKAKERLILLNG